jgi:hypothetical protein
VVPQVAEGVDLPVYAATVAGLVIWEADGIGQVRPFSPSYPSTSSWAEEGLPEEKSMCGRREGAM